MKCSLWSLVLLVLWQGVSWGADARTSPIDKTQQLVELKTDFGLCDGGAWNGGNSLYIPDVKAKKLFLYKISADKKLETKGEWTELSADQGAFSGTFFQLGELYISDNAAGRILKSRNGKQFTELAAFEDKARPNDITVSSQGDVYATMTKEGQVRKISADGKVTVFAQNIESPNGIAISPDQRTIYVSLYKPGKIVSIAIQDDGSAAPVKDFATVEPAKTGALADGMCVDRAGNVYCACAESVFIWDADGKYLDKITPPKRPINCVFGGVDGNELYLSTFGGVYMQPMLVNGVQPHPPVKGDLSKEQGTRPSTEIPESITANLDVTYHQYGPRKVLMDIFVPNTIKEAKPCIVLVHGGAWLKGDKKKFRSLAIKLAEKGYVTSAIEYRLGFEASFPAGIQDCLAAVEFMTSNGKKYEVDINRIGAVGGSAGGHLVGLMATGWDNARLRPEDADLKIPVRVKAAVVMAGPLDIATGKVEEGSHRGMTSNATHWIGGCIEDFPEMFHLADATEKITANDPPILFLTGSKDNPARDQHAMEKLKAVGVWTNQIQHEGAAHGHWNSLPWIDQVVLDVDHFMKEKLK